MQERNCNAALNLAREYHGDNNLKKTDVGPTKPVNFEGIAKLHNVRGSVDTQISTLNVKLTLILKTHPPSLLMSVVAY